LVYEGRVEEMDEIKARYVKKTDARTLGEVIQRRRRLPRPVGGRRAEAGMVARMAKGPLIMALANPTPEITPELVKSVRPTRSSAPAVRTTRTRSTTSCASPSSSAARSMSAQRRSPKK
jgi:malic enzyme